MTFDELNQYLKDRGAESSHPFGNDLIAYSMNEERLAYIGEESSPFRISLRCSRELGEHLASQYESVMPGHKLDPKKWITILDTGQLSEQEIFDLIDHAISVSTSVK